MTMSSKYLLLSLIVLTPISVLPQTPQAEHPQASQTAKKPAATAHATQQQNEGERIFQENCSRCHNAPNGFSPRISGTILRHMRVRASLSQHDEQELLRFFNP
jgi:cytochrome c5